MGILAALMFSFNPFTFFLTAVWGAPESIVSLFVTASMFMLYKGKYFAASCLLGFSLMVKPYTIIFLLPIILFSYPALGIRKILLQSFLFALSALFVASPWLIAQKDVFIDAMWSGALHNLGVRIPEGIIWCFPSFWLIVNLLCNISGFSYKIVAPLQIYVFIFLTLAMCFMIIKLRLNYERKNLWFISHLFLFCFMMFFPSAHEKWVYSCFPLLLISPFLIHENFFLLSLTYFMLAFSLSGAVYGNGNYFFESTDFLPMPRIFVYGGSLAEKWYYFLWGFIKVIGDIFSQVLSAFILLGILSLHLLFLYNMSKFGEHRKEKPESESLGSRQMRLDIFLASSAKEGEQAPVNAVSTDFEKNISKEAKEATSAFNIFLTGLQEIFLGISEIEKMLRSGEISENTYQFLMSMLVKEALAKLNEIYLLKDKLELIKARARVEWAREKRELDRLLSPENQRILEWDSHLRKNVYMSLNVLEEVISLIEKSLSSLTFEKELAIIEQCLSLIRKKNVSIPMETIGNYREICKQRLYTISKNWSLSRPSIIKQIASIEEKISQVKEEIKEVEIRFTVGELDRKTYEHKLNYLQASLQKMEEDNLKTQDHLQEIDEKIFRCFEAIKYIN